MAGSLILFTLFIMIYILISDVITIFFRLTGLTEEKARFQVISLLTNSGFTTRESEAVVSSKIRRRLARATMLFGYAFTVTIVSTTVNFFMTLGKSELNALLYLIPVLLALMTGFHLLRRSAVFKTKFDNWIERIGNRLIFGQDANAVVLVEEYGEMVVAHIYLRTVPALLENTTLAQSGLMSRYNIMVLMVKTRTDEARQARAATILKKDDIIMVLGRRKAIREVFEKGASAAAR